MSRSPEGTLNRPYDSHVAPEPGPRLTRYFAACKGTTGYGEPCRLGARKDSPYCRWHRNQAVRA